MSSSVTLAGVDNDVHIGSWTNYSRGRIHGATITVTPRDGALLIAFLALFVQLTGSRFWRLMCFAIHQILSSDKPEDGLYHQRQVVLRNTGSDLTTIFELSRVGWAWRSRAAKPFRRVLPWIVVAIIHLAAFTVAGIFSSQVTAAPGNEVLLSSANCGYTNFTIVTGPDQLADDLEVLLPYASALTQAAASYAQQCYTENATAQQCPTYAQRYLASTQHFNLTCPFGDLCVEANNAFRMDTGYLNSQHDFGINSPPRDRFLFREMTTCAVIKTDGYTQPGSGGVNNSQGNYLEYLYGEDVNAGTPYTYRYHTALETNLTAQFEEDHDYTLYNVEYMPYSEPGWDPIPELNRTDADTVMAFLSANDMNFASPVGDPWFSAHVRGTVGTNTQTNDSTVQFYYRDRPMSPMACTLQYQLCNPNIPETQGSCTPIVGSEAIYTYASDREGWNSTAQYSSVKIFANTLYGSFSIDVGQVIAGLASGALLARQGMLSGYQGPLPANQWQLEVAHWHNTYLAMLQRQLIEDATGPSDPKMIIYQQKADADNPVVCQPQIIRSNAYTSFSTLGLGLILGLGGSITLLSFLIEPIVGRHARHHVATAHPARLEWLSDQKFQLQRLAYEHAGSGPWRGALCSVPVTEGRERLLPMLDRGKRGHPLLKTERKWTGGLSEGRGAIGDGDELGEGSEEESLRKHPAHMTLSEGFPLRPMSGLMGGYEQVGRRSEEDEGMRPYQDV